MGDSKTRMQPIVIAVEGGLAAGKTTFCKFAASKAGVGYIPEYMEFLPDVKKFYANSPIQRFEELLQIEEKKRGALFKRLKRDKNIKLILLDRSYLSLIAHNHAANINQPRNSFRLAKANLIRPDVVIYLDPGITMREKFHRQRMGALSTTNSMLLSDEFDKKFSAYVKSKGGNIPFFLIETTNFTVQETWQTVKSLISTQLEHKRSLKSSQDIQRLVRSVARRCILPL